MDNDDYCGEERVEVGAEVVDGTGQPQPLEVPVEVQVATLVEHPDTPSPVSPATPLPVMPSPPQHSPVGDARKFMGFYSADDLTELEQWAVDEMSLRCTPGLRLEEPEVPQNMETFLRYTLGPQWEYKIIYPAGKFLIERMRAYIAGYNLVTNFTRQQWLSLSLSGRNKKGRSNWSRSPTPAGSCCVRACGPLLLAVGGI